MGGPGPGSGMRDGPGRDLRRPPPPPTFMLWPQGTAGLPADPHGSLRLLKLFLSTVLRRKALMPGESLSPALYFFHWGCSLNSSSLSYYYYYFSSPLLLSWFPRLLKLSTVSCLSSQFGLSLHSWWFCLLCGVGRMRAQIYQRPNPNHHVDCVAVIA